MIRFGISWVARLLGVSGLTIQQPTSRGSLQNLNISKKVLPFNPDNIVTKDLLSDSFSNSSDHLKRFQDTQARISKGNNISYASNDKDLVSVIATLKSKLYQESIKNKHYSTAFNELNDRLVDLEKIVQPEKKTDFQKLQGWVHSKRNLH